MSLVGKLTFLWLPDLTLLQPFGLCVIQDEICFVFTVSKLPVIAAKDKDEDCQV